MYYKMHRALCKKFMQLIIMLTNKSILWNPLLFIIYELLLKKQQLAIIWSMS